MSLFPSNEGFIQYYNNKYLLIYNDILPTTRIRWTLFHELGHYFLGHLKDDNSILFSDIKAYNSIKEKEANYFARHSVCPAPILLFVNDYFFGETKDNFFNLFGISKEVYTYCSDHAKKHKLHYDICKYPKLSNLFYKSIRKMNEKSSISKLLGTDLKLDCEKIPHTLNECYQYLLKEDCIKLYKNKYKAYTFYLTKPSFSKNFTFNEFDLYIEPGCPWETNVFIETFIYGRESSKDYSIEATNRMDILEHIKYRVKIYNSND